MLGDTWGGETQAPADSVLSVDYYRQKALEFQVALNSLDEVGRALYAVERVANCDAELAAEWFSKVQEFQSKRTQFVIAAESMNVAASGLNAVGVRFPVLSYSQGLGALPAIPMAAIAVAVGVAAGLIVWGKEFAVTVREMLKRWQYSDAFEQLTPAEKAEMFAEMMNADTKIATAQAANEGGTLESIASIVKWIAIGTAVFAGYKAFQQIQNKRG